MAQFDPFADFRRDGQVAIVTGGAQDIGEAIARIFAKAFPWLASRAGSRVSGQTIQVHGSGARVRLKTE